MSLQADFEEHCEDFSVGDGGSYEIEFPDNFLFFFFEWLCAMGLDPL